MSEAKNKRLFHIIKSIVIMNKIELAKNAGVKKEAVDAVLNALVEAVKNEGALVLPGFGSFKVVERPARQAKNPRTGEMVAVPAKKVVRFKPGKSFAC